MAGGADGGFGGELVFAEFENLDALERGLRCLVGGHARIFLDGMERVGAGDNMRVGDASALGQERGDRFLRVGDVAGLGVDVGG